MPTLHLASDNVRSTEHHLDEFAGRGSLVLLTLVISSVFWWLQTDQLLNAYLATIVPCDYQQCMVVFDPSAWISARWMLILMLAIFSSMPVIIWQINRFAAPGLLPREKVWMHRFTTLTPILGAGLVYLTLFIVLPKIFIFGHQQNLANGLVARYDAAELMRITLIVAWVELLILLALMSVIIGGFSGLLDSQNANWWRLRVHGFLLGLLWLLIPDTLSGIRLATIASSALIVELSIRPFAKREGIHRGLEAGRGLLDEEGGLRRIGIVDCRCNGVCPKFSQDIIPSGTTAHRAYSLCTSAHERDLLIERAREERWTDVLIAGCDGSPLPFHLQDSLSILAIKLNGLNCLKTITARPMPAHNSSLEYSLSLAGQIDPWSKKGIRQRQLKILEKFARTAYSENLDNTAGKLFYSTNGFALPWGIVLSSNDYFLKGPGVIDADMTKICVENGWSLIDIDEMNT